MAEVATTTADEQIVIFRLLNEEFGFDIFRIHEIIRIQEITPVPGTPEHVRGLINLRGRTVPVMDLRSRLGMPEADKTDDQRIIVVDVEDEQIGVIVDEVREVVTIPVDEIEPTPPLVAHIASEAIRGVVKHKTDLVTLLNIDVAVAA